MVQALHSIENEPAHTVEIVIHVTETLGEGRRDDLVTALEREEHIVSAQFCPIHYHLLLTAHNRGYLPLP